MVSLEGPRTAAGRYLLAALTDDRHEMERLRDEESPEIIASSAVGGAVLRRLVERMFPRGGHIEDVRRYVAAARDRRAEWTSSDARVAEAVIRWVLGDEMITYGISAEEAGAVAVDLVVDLIEGMMIREEEFVDILRAAESDAERQLRSASRDVRVGTQEEGDAGQAGDK